MDSDEDHQARMFRKRTNSQPLNGAQDIVIDGFTASLVFNWRVCAACMEPCRTTERLEPQPFAVFTVFVQTAVSM